MDHGGSCVVVRSRRLDKANAMDFDDLLAQGVFELLSKYPDAC